jgi:hypothetical protein
MNLERYTYFTNEDFLDYEFHSVGPKGKIKKIVHYEKVNDDPVVYNLAFGDFNETTGKIDDAVQTNNDDRDMVLATVASTIIDFTAKNGNVYVYATGSTLSRTRLYQMGIAKILAEIHQDFEIYGLYRGEWHPFRVSINFEACLVKRK